MYWLIGVGAFLFWIGIGKFALPLAEVLGAMAGNEEYEKEKRKK